MNELASGDGWKLYKEEDGTGNGIRCLELHTIYGVVNVRLIGRAWIDMSNSILKVYENLKAQGPIEVESKQVSSHAS